MINLTVVIDNDEAIRKLRELQNVAKTTTSSVVKDSERMDASWQQMKNTLMGLTAGVSFAALAKQVVQIRGEVQQLEVAFETMLGSKEKADTLMSEIIDLAAKTPFGLQDVSNATKMLLAYGSTAEEVTGEIKMLGNIASGLSIPLNDLIYLYGTTRTQGRMFTMDLRQFMGRGIPLAEELAKQFGVTKDKVGELVTAGKVGFDDMAKALQAMSSEGGKFYNLMDKQSQTISGQISNLEDSIYQMFNEIGESSEGVISDLISGASWVVEHYQEVLNVLKYVIAAYGSYKAALILVAAAQKALALAQATAGLLNMTKAANGLAMAMRGLTAAAGPIGLIVSVLGLAVTAFMSFNSKTEEATKHMGALEKAAYDEYIEVNRLVGRLQDANISENERNSILNKLKTVAPSIVDGLKDEANMTAQLTANLKDYNAEQIKRIQLAALDDKVEEEMKKVANARTSQAEAQLEWSKFISDYQAKKAVGAQPTIDIDSRIKNQGLYVTPRGKQKEAIEKVAMEAIDRILSDVNTTDAYKALRIGEYLNFGGKVERAEIGLNAIGGTDIGDVVSTLNEANENVRKAETAFDAFVKEDKQLREIIGSVADNTKNDAEAVRTYAQAFTEAQEAYLSTQKELAKANADRAAGKSTISEKEYLDIKDRAELAKKEYQKLGGVTSTKEQTEKEKKAKEAAKLAMELRNKADQAEIDAMAEGTEKKIAQIEHDYNLRKQAIAKEQAELIAAQGTPLTTEQQNLFSTLNRDNANTYATQLEAAIFGDVDAQAKAAIAKMKTDKAAWDEYLIEYGTFQEKLVAITAKYSRLIAEAQTEGKRKALEAERDAILAEYEVQASDWAKSLVDKSTEQLQTMASNLQSVVDSLEIEYNALDSSDTDEAKQLRETINMLKAQIKELQEQLNKANKAVKDDNWAEATQVFQNISQAANDAAEGLAEFDEGAANILHTMGELAGSAINLIGAIQAVATAATAATGTISTMEKASVILAVIGAAIQAVSVLIGLFKGSDEVEQTMRQFKELNTELERFRKLAQIDSVEGTIFGENAFGNFSNNLRVMREAYKELEATRQTIETKRYDNQLSYFERLLEQYEREGNLRSAAYIQKKIDELKASGLANQGLTNALSGMTVRLGKKRNSTLGEQYPELFTGGEVSLEGLKNLQESDVWDKLSQENRDLIDELIADWERYEDATEAVSDYLTGIFGELGYTMTQALVDSFASGTDAALAFGDAASDMIEKLATDMIHAALVQPIIDKYAEAIDLLNADESLSPEDRIRELTRLIGEMSQEVAGTQDMVNAAAEKVRDGAAAAGIEGVFDGSSSQSATSKGFQAMSQETGSELNGRFTDIQGQAHRIAEAVEFCRNIQLEKLGEVQSINSTVAMIHNDTSLIANHTKALASIKEDISTIRKAIDNGVI